MTIKHLTFCLGIAIASTMLGNAQACPNWSAKFDGITNKDIVAKLKTTDWDAAMTMSGGPEAIIASNKVTIKDAQSRRDAAKQGFEAISSDHSDTGLNVTWNDCKPPADALAAEACQYLNMSEMILTLQGMNELYQCRQSQ